MRTSVHIAKHRIGTDVAKEWTDIATDVESRGAIAVPTSVPAGEMSAPMHSTCRNRHRLWHNQCRTPTFHPPAVAKVSQHRYWCLQVFSTTTMALVPRFPTPLPKRDSSTPCPHGPTWANMDRHRPTLADIGRHGHTWTDIVQHGPTRADMDRHRLTSTDIG